MGVDAADVNGDRRLDLFVTNLADETNSLYLGQGAGAAYLDGTNAAGLGTHSLPFTGFGTLALDAEHDGDLDLVVVNGRVKGRAPLPGAQAPPPWDRLAEPNFVYLNDGAGHFEPMSADACGDLCRDVEASRGLASGDVDRDGDLDLLVVNVESPVRLYLNQQRSAGHWLAVLARDERYHREAPGARVTVTAGERSWTAGVGRNRSFMSSSAPEAHFGLGAATGVDQIRVDWPDGLSETFPAGCIDCTVTVERGRGTALP
jgi:hypothetical protein